MNFTVKIKYLKKSSYWFYCKKNTLNVTGLSDEVEMRQKYYKLDLHFPLKSNALIVRLATNQSTTVWVWIFWQKKLDSQPKS